MSCCVARLVMLKCFSNLVDLCHDLISSVQGGMVIAMCVSVEDCTLLELITHNTEQLFDDLPY